jgi:glyoxylase-like metal-dependent hydrolase (beta-lactamase superfamily II)
LLVVGFPAAVFGSNCYVVAPAAGERCIVVDPGIDVTTRLDEIIHQHHVQPAAVLLTHGHIDHTFSVTPVCGARDIPAYIHPGDAELLADPAKGLGAGIVELFGGRLSWTEPDDVRSLADGATMEVAGLAIKVDHAPGHTRGSVLFRLPGEEALSPGPGPVRVPPGPEIMFSGDVLFAGSIGRTDLPGGDPTAMMRSLATKVLPLADETVVLPGHGPQTTIGRERSTNPFLVQARSAAPARGL